MSCPAAGTKSVLRIHLYRVGPADQDTYEQALALLRDITPLVQALPPDGADLDVTGAHRYFDRDTRDLALLVQLRLAALYGLQATIGAGPNRMLASMAAAVTAPGHCTIIDPTPDAVAGFLHPQPVAALFGVGPATARTLADYGIHRIGDLTDVPALTLQRILGKTTATTLHERARGHDPRPVIPAAAPQSAGATWSFPHDELDHHAHRRALIGLTERLGLRLRTSGQVAARLSLTVVYADGTSTQRTRTLAELTAHSPTLTTTAYDLYTRLALERARVRTITLRAEHLTNAQHATHQLLLDPADDKRRRIEEASDQARARFGDHAVRPSTLSQVSSEAAPTAGGGPAWSAFRRRGP
ncbi:DNA polymerase IV [Streptomyces sp. YIM 130001]|uniref:DNA polymerase Y family protein n=1 Tax=Streptomyces sp. YIM 130001 TaxID=2259644 RepID=UPI000E65D1CF|nr:hypothetical protein [Streptomyces sp. YIM 130001]RII07968.1 DNA polymerase IV [Streptomyces sp. YIM 130001]